MIYSFFLATGLVSLAQSLSLVETTCRMRMTFPTGQDLTLEGAFQVETLTADYFTRLLFKDESSSSLLLPSSVDPLTLNVDVADRIITSSAITVSAAVSLLYEYDESTDGPVDLKGVLTQAVQEADPLDPTAFPFSTDSSVTVFRFEEIEQGSNVLDNRSENGRSAAELALIVAAAFLSLMLLMVSSVLLYITGGWKSCKRKVVNCLFEEVDDDEGVYGVPHKTNTYPIHQTSEDDEESQESHSHVASSLAPSHASGILGVARNRDNPAAGMGINGDDFDDDESSMMYGDDTLSPVSQPPRVPGGGGDLSLGISHRLDSQPASARGMSGMVMERFARDQGN